MHIVHYHGGYFESFNPGALRTANLANALAMRGNTVEVVTGDRGDVEISKSRELYNLHDNVALRAGGAPLTTYLIDRMPRRIDPLSRGLASTRDADVIIVFGATPKTIKRVRGYAEERGLTFIVDVDEWMGPTDFTWRSWLTLFPLRYEVLMRTLPRLAPASFAISHTMKQHMQSAGGSAMVVPPLHAPPEREPREPDAGSTGFTRLLIPGVRRGGRGKDRLSLQLVTEAIESRPELAAAIKVDIVGGVEEREAIRIASHLARLVDVTDHGRLPWPDARLLLQSVDWLVALRDPTVRRLRYAFPSKVTEALVAGTPVLANDYSDMRSYIGHEEAGIVVDRLEADAVADALWQAVKNPIPRAVVARRAQRLFSPSAMGESIEEFIRIRMGDARA